MKSFLRLKPFIIENKRYYIVGLIALIVINSMQLIIPKILGWITDYIASGQATMLDIFYFILLIIFLSTIIAVGRYLWRMNVMGNARRLEYTLRNMLFKHLQSLSQEYFNKKKTGDLMAHATNDIQSVRMALGPGVVLITDAVFLAFVIVIIMGRTINFQLTLLALLPLPFLALISTKFGKIIHRRFKKVQEAFSDLSDKAQENFSGIRVVKGFAQEKEEIEKFHNVNQFNVDRNMHLVRIWGFFFPLIQFLSALSFIILLSYGGMLVIYGDISLGDFVAFNSYLGLITWPMMALGWVLNILQRGKASMDRLNTIFNEQPKVHDEKDLAQLNNINGKITFNKLTFAYPETTQNVLNNISFTILPGQSIGVLGRTGSGKTTIMNLLLRLYNPPPATIFIDGIDINKLPLKLLRENIGYVPQDNFLFSTTIKHNLDFADTNKNLQQLEYYAKLSEVHDNISEFPKKYDTLVGERGVTLSGGQKQRLSIARALVKDPAILILDDSLSAVDTETEEAILQNLKSFMQNRTSIIVSHRISTLKHADEILVLDEGQLVQKGSHDELLTQEGFYQELYQKQLLEEKIESAH